MSLDLLYVFLGEVSVQVLCPFFSWVICFPGVELRLWRKGNPSALLVGMQTGATTVENSTELPQKTKNGTVFFWQVHCWDLP